MPYNIWCDGCKNHIGMGELHLPSASHPTPNHSASKTGSPFPAGPVRHHLHQGPLIRNRRGDRLPSDRWVVDTSLQNSEEAQLCHFLAGRPSAGDLVSVPQFTQP